MPSNPGQKPWYRPRNLILFFTGLFLAILGREVYLALTAKPGQSVDFAARMAALIQTNQPEGVPADAPDAWPVLRATIDRMDAVQEDLWPQALRRGNTMPILDFSVLGSPKTKEMYDDTYTWEAVAARAKEGLAAMRNAGVFESLRELAQMRRAIRPTPPGPLISILLPDLGKARQIARMNGGRMFLAHESGDDAEFTDAFEQTLAIARMMTQQATLIEQLVGIAICALADSRLREALTERPFPAPTLEDLLAAMDRQLPLRPISGVLEGERLCAMDIIQWSHTDDGRGDGRLIMSSLTTLGGGGAAAGGGGGMGGGLLSSLSGLKILNLTSIAFPGKAATIRKANAFYDLAISLAGSPPEKRAAATKELEDWIENRLPKRYLLVRLIIPAIGKSLSSDLQIRADVAGTRLMLAVELFNARNGRYPASLDELTPSILPELPIDPCNGRPFGYRLLQQGEDTILRADGSARPYVLYSFGVDAQDNNGKVNPKNQHTALSSLGTGKNFDFIFNMPRDRPKPEPAPEPPPDQPAPAAEPPPAAPK